MFAATAAISCGGRSCTAAANKAAMGSHMAYSVYARLDQQTDECGRRYLSTESMNKLYEPLQEEVVQALLERQSLWHVTGTARLDVHHLPRHGPTPVAERLRRQAISSTDDAFVALELDAKLTQSGGKCGVRERCDFDSPLGSVDRSEVGRRQAGVT